VVDELGETESRRLRGTQRVSGHLADIARERDFARRNERGIEGDIAGRARQG
jgi:hypothetical protein